MRHIQRTKVLAYVIDVSDTVNLPNQVYKEIQKELLYYDGELLRKPTIIVANKMDEEGAKEGLRLLKSCTKLPVIPVSAKEGRHIKDVAEMIRRACIVSS